VRPALRANNLIEQIAFRLNLAPVPAAEVLTYPAAARSVMAGVRLGVFARLAQGPVTAAELARALELTPEGTRLLLDSLAAVGHVHRNGDSYAITNRARRWLDPQSDRYVGTFLEHSYEYWEWWDNMEEVVRTGRSFEIHERPPDDPRWHVYIRGQYELARLSAPEVAKALRLPPKPGKLLDAAGGHGWFSAELCRRHPTLEATVRDLPGSVAVGREIIAEAGMSDRVEHVEGDLATADFGGPYDGALCFNIIHHLTPAQNLALLRRLHEALAPGGTLAVLDLFTAPRGRQPEFGAFLGLFFHLTSAAATYEPGDLFGWLAEAGFERPRKVRIRSIPVQTLYEARRP
jgi:2-polyprenyl-3-methyl-5-hydroxy-6-metoxy-1,4-benzoquinol methylase